MTRGDLLDQVRADDRIASAVVEQRARRTMTNNAALTWTIRDGLASASDGLYDFRAWVPSDDPSVKIGAAIFRDGFLIDTLPRVAAIELAQLRCERWWTAHQDNERACLEWLESEEA
jgi:hypothetical protein